MPAIENPGSASERRLRLDDILPLLVADGRLTPTQAEDLQRLWVHNAVGRVHLHPLVWLANKDLLDARDPNLRLGLECLTAWFAEQLQLPYLRIDPLKIDMEAVTGVISHAYAVRFSMLPVQVGEREVVFATCEPLLREWERELQRVLRKEVRRVLASPVDIARYQDELFGLSHSIRRARTRSSDQDRSTSITDIEALVELGKAGKLDANDHHIVHIVDWLLQFAFDQRASDIHLEPRRETGNVRFRIDGVLHNVYQMPAPVLVAVTARIKALGRMDIVERRKPQDGRLKTRTPGGQEVELRLSIMPTAFGEKLVMRIFDPQVLVRGLTDLGFSKSDALYWDEMTSRTHGILLVTGPTGSGKTTTLYSTLKHLASPEVNVSSIEDPVEMVEPAFNQMQVNPAIGVDFATGVRTLLRQDPDIIMVGEIRDLETANMAIQAALTGHLVLSTLHTNDASAAITRLADIGVPSYLINATLLGVVAQRLVRILCPQCKKAVEVDPILWESLVSGWEFAAPTQLQQGVGCNECRHTGYRGRVGIYEILRMTPPVRAQINQQTDINAIRRLGIKEGMEPLRISGARKVHAGLTTVEEILRVAPMLEEW
jgi:general secretion pathway protein E